jgi:hypothetical protein
MHWWLEPDDQPESKDDHQDIIAEYNREKDPVTIEKSFEAFSSRRPG